MEDIEKFIRGFTRFQARYFGEDNVLYDTLRNGQEPATLLIGCCDSRVDPMLLTGSDPGDLFVVRNIANLVPPCTPQAPPGVSSAIEFAVCNLKVARIIVLGHAHCGGIHALMEPHRQTTENDFVGKWMAIAEPVRERVLRDLSHRSSAARDKACELASILHSLDNLLTYPWIRQRVEEGGMTLHGWYFDIDNGALLAYSARQQQFLSLVRALSESESELGLGIESGPGPGPGPVAPTWSDPDLADRDSAITVSDGHDAVDDTAAIPPGQTPASCQPGHCD